ncbi:related to C6 transcription factor [Lecanosticta acicola]|uniref:Related to C6 transcription factor n=1 Tax=Lecanosticta acicola TaxID=111012 RepID=A0AAI8Z7B9_9PEZI|nr:related to C6 transcription factor [Lecanosticta acicola]
MESAKVSSAHQLRHVAIAPAAADSSHPPALHKNGGDDDDDVPQMPYTCVTCGRRKVKCDKTGPPCGTCKKAKQECFYQEPPPRKKKRKANDDIHDRLDRYEQLLRENGLLPKEDPNIPATPSMHSPDAGYNPSTTAASWGAHEHTTEKPQLASGAGRLVKGRNKTRYIDSQIWRSLGDDLHPSSDEEDGPDHDHGPASLAADAIDPLTGAFLPTVVSYQNLLNLHPTYDVAMKLWKQYVQNADPVCKLLHVPTVTKILQRAAADPSSMSRVTECLLFSIYHFAVYSSTDAECDSMFLQPKHVLQKRYHDATRHALVACRFLRTTDLTVLQAYMLYLLGMRNTLDPHTFWILSGVAVRIGQRMGLHRDGDEMGLNPYDVQMRRRVFWQLLPIDGMSAQLSGTGIAITADSWDTKQPLNINDEDIWPDMETAPVPRKGATDMMFVLARTEVGMFHQKVKPALGNWSRLWEGTDIPFINEAMQKMEETMENKYIRYCDISDPMHCLTLSMARGSLCVARLRVGVAATKGKPITSGERKELVELSYKVLDHAIAVRANGNLARYLWHMAAFFHFDPLIWLLNELRRDDCAADPDTVWSKTERIFDLHPEVLDHRRSIDTAMSRLTLRAWDATQAKAAVPRPEPPFVHKLRTSLSRKEASKSSTQTPVQKPNPFDPGFEASNDIPVASYLSSNQPFAFSDYNALNDMNADIDWMFWDQLVRDPTAFPQL